MDYLVFNLTGPILEASPAQEERLNYKLQNWGLSMYIFMTTKLSNFLKILPYKLV